MDAMQDRPLEVWTRGPDLSSARTRRSGRSRGTLDSACRTATCVAVVCGNSPRRHRTRSSNERSESAVILTPEVPERPLDETCVPSWRSQRQIPRSSWAGSDIEVIGDPLDPEPKPARELDQVPLGDRDVELGSSAPRVPQLIPQLALVPIDVSDVAVLVEYTVTGDELGFRRQSGTR